MYGQISRELSGAASPAANRHPDDASALILALRKAGTQPREHPGLLRFSVADLEQARPRAAGLPDGEQLLEAIDQELVARRRLCERSGNGLLMNLPGAPGPTEPWVLAEVFRPPHELPAQAQVEAFLAYALAQGTLTQRMADEIRFFEALERSRTQGPRWPQDLLKHLASAPRSSPEVVAHLYRAMSVPAASAAMSVRYGWLQSGAMPQRQKDEFLKTMVLRMVEGQDPMCSHPAAGHTLASVLTRRIGQVYALPGGDRLSMDVLAERVVLGMRGTGFLRDEARD